MLARRMLFRSRTFSSLPISPTTSLGRNVKHYGRIKFTNLESGRKRKKEGHKREEEAEKEIYKYTYAGSVARLVTVGSENLGSRLVARIGANACTY